MQDSNTKKATKKIKIVRTSQAQLSGPDNCLHCQGVSCYEGVNGMLRRYSLSSSSWGCKGSVGKRQRHNNALR
jgi:hypothetical protein